jgi:hypothetical protein
LRIWSSSHDLAHIFKAWLQLLFRKETLRWGGNKYGSKKALSEATATVQVKTRSFSVINFNNKKKLMIPDVF